MKHVVCFSKGHSSGRVAEAVVRRFGKENVVLVNHNINPRKEKEDIKRFGREVSEYLEYHRKSVAQANARIQKQAQFMADVAINKLVSMGYVISKPCQ